MLMSGSFIISAKPTLSRSKKATQTSTRVLVLVSSVFNPLPPILGMNRDYYEIRAVSVMLSPRIQLERKQQNGKITSSLSAAYGFGIDHCQIDHTSFLSSPEFCRGDVSFTSFNAEPDRGDLFIRQPSS